MTRPAGPPAVSVFAPGSASNLGPGFDCFGVAFTGKGDTIDAWPCEAPGVAVLSVSDDRIPADPQRNTAAIAAVAALRKAGVADKGVWLAIRKGLPLAGGMGGSAASAVGGAVAVDRLFRLGLTAEDLLECALDAEAAVAGRHPDNVAPCLFGGAVLIGGTPQHFTRVTVHPSLALVLVTPDYRVETLRARAVVPRTLERSEAIAQAAGLAALVLGLERGDGGLIRTAMVDHIAEPARLPLYPGYSEARRAALERGAHGIAVSGAGPTLVAVVPVATSAAVAAALVAGYAAAGITAHSLEARVDMEGARVVK